MMLRYYLTIAVMLVIMIIQYRHYRHLLAAPVIYPVMWMLAFVGLIIAGDMFYEVSIGTCILFVSGYILFSLGFRLGILIKSRSNRYGYVAKSEEIEDREIRVNTDIGDQRLGLNIVTGICVLIGLAYAVYLFKFIDFEDVYQSILRIRGMVGYNTIDFPYILTILRYFIRCSLWYISLQLFRIPKDTDYKGREGYNDRADLTIRILIILVSSVFIVVADLSRNDILFTFLPVLFIYILSRRLLDKKITVMFIVSLIFFSSFFIWFTSFKGGVLEDDLNQEDSQNEYIHYLSGSLVALDVKNKTGAIQYLSFEDGRGVHTFSLICALRDKLFGTNDTPEVIREKRRIGPASTTNVYTVYEWTGMDWGLLYALLLQLIFGMLYGILYHGAVRQRIGSVFWYSVLSYSLIMMFFQDQFFSISQSWLIIIVICYGIFFLCNRAAVSIRGIGATKTSV